MKKPRFKQYQIRGYLVDLEEKATGYKQWVLHLPNGKDVAGIGLVALNDYITHHLERSQ